MSGKGRNLTTTNYGTPINRDVPQQLIDRAESICKTVDPLYGNNDDVLHALNSIVPYECRKEMKMYGVTNFSLNGKPVKVLYTDGSNNISECQYDGTNVSKSPLW